MARGEGGWVFDVDGNRYVDWVLSWVTEATLNDGDKIVIGDHLFRFDLLDEIDREFQQQIHRLIAHDELTGLLTSKSFFSELVERLRGPRLRRALSAS